MQATQSSSYTGQHVFVTGLLGGREVFLGKALGEPEGGFLALEGRTIVPLAPGFLAIRPFNTMARFPLDEPRLQIQVLAGSEPREEALDLLKTPTTTIGCATHPFVFRWIENALRADGGLPLRAAERPIRPVHVPAPFAAHLQALHASFSSAAEQFRRALFLSPQVSGSRELDKVTELEGDLAIEIGKHTNQVAVRFHQIVSGERDLERHLEAYPLQPRLAAPGDPLAGWTFLLQRLQAAKSWARRMRKPALVRDLNTVIKDAILGTTELVLDHSAALDTLIAETFGQYGISYEIHGEITPFPPQAIDLPERTPAPHLTPVGTPG